MHAPPDLKSERAARPGSPDRKPEYPKPDNIAETAADRQAPSALDLQIFCLARRFALNAPRSLKLLRSSFMEGCEHERARIGTI